MPEHDTPDLADLDALFAALERDVADRTRPPGAPGVLRDARRHRRTRWVAVAAAAVVVAGAAVVVHGADGGDSAASRPAPAPAPFTLRVLDRATRGWLGDWAVAGELPRNPAYHQQPLACDFQPQVPQNSKTGDVAGAEFDSTRPQSASFGASVQTQARAWYDAIPAALDGCAGSAVHRFSYDDGTDAFVASLPVRGGGRTLLAGAVNGDRVADFMVGPSATEASSQTVARVADALVAALNDHAAYGPTHDNLSSQKVAENDVRLAPSDLVAALSGWANAYDVHRSRTVPDPCNLDWRVGGMTLGFGGTGESWWHQFDSAAHAREDFRRLQEMLGDCTPSSRLVRSARGPSVFVATGDPVLWAVQRDDWIAVVWIPAGPAQTPPPDAVTARVGRLMLRTIDAGVAAAASASASPSAGSR